MKYWKRIDDSGTVTTIEAYSHDLTVVGAIEIDEQEFNSLLTSLIPPFVPDPDYIRACELLESSPDVITAPEMWELLRLFGKRLGYQ